jgi:hypothetical protein
MDRVLRRKPEPPEPTPEEQYEKERKADLLKKNEERDRNGGDNDRYTTNPWAAPSECQAYDRAMTTEPKQDDGGNDGPEPHTTTPAIEAEDYDDGLTPISTDYVYRGRNPDDVERR